MLTFLNMTISKIEKKVIFWQNLLYVFTWLFFSILMSEAFKIYRTNVTENITITLSVLLLSVPPFYIAPNILIPRYLFKKKIFQFVLYSLITVAVSGIVSMVGTRFAVSLFHPDFSIWPDTHALVFNLNIFLWNATMGFFLATAIKIFFDIQIMEQQIQVIKNEQLQVDLIHLRQQLHPATMQSIMDNLLQSVENESNEVLDAVHKFRSLLHYQIEECKNDTIKIENELIFLNSFISVQRRRMEEGSIVSVTSSGAMSGYDIVPLLCMPLLENAFKHISNYDIPSRNKILIHFSKKENENFTMTVSNTYDKLSKSTSQTNAGGVGIQNLNRRLQLLYPGQLLLYVNTSNNIYSTTIHIPVINQMPNQ